MNEIQAYQEAENVAMGQALMELLAEMYCCEPTERSIERSVYKHTDCGAWIHFTQKGVKIGSIVEGSDAETESYDIGYNGDNEKFKTDYWKALEEIEFQADALWREANGDE